jgi:hypothetical protein
MQSCRDPESTVSRIIIHQRGDGQQIHICIKLDTHVSFFGSSAKGMSIHGAAQAYVKFLTKRGGSFQTEAGGSSFKPHRQPLLCLRPGKRDRHKESKSKYFGYSCGNCFHFM